MSRDCDYHGPVVNVAARAPWQANPGTILATHAIADELDRYRFDVESVGSRELKGIGEPVELFAVTWRT